MDTYIITHTHTPPHPYPHNHQQQKQLADLEALVTQRLDTKGDVALEAADRERVSLYDLAVAVDEELSALRSRVGRVAGRLQVRAWCVFGWWGGDRRRMGEYI